MPTINTNIAAILSLKNLTGVIESVVNGVPTSHLPPEFFSVKRDFYADYATFDQIQSTRQTAPGMEYGAIPKSVVQQGVQEVTVKLPSFGITQNYTANTLLSLRQIGSIERDNKGEKEIIRQTKLIAQRMQNTRATLVNSILASGAIYMDNKYNLQAFSGGSWRTISMNIPAGNQGGLNVEGTGNIISANWNIPTTDIISQVRALQSAALRLTGMPLKTVLYGRNIPGYLQSNNNLNARLTTIQQKVEISGSLQNGEIPDGFLGLNWRSVDQAFFQDASGVNRTFFGGDYLGFLPEINDNNYMYAEGQNVIPSELGMVGEDAEALIASLKLVTGMASWAQVTTKPVGIEQTFLDTGCPFFTVPSSVFLANANPN